MRTALAIKTPLNGKKVKIQPKKGEQKEDTEPDNNLQSE